MGRITQSRREAAPRPPGRAITSHAWRLISLIPQPPGPGCGENPAHGPGGAPKLRACYLRRSPAMSDVTYILEAIEHGGPRAAEKLLPLVYDELRKLAARRLAQERPGQTLQATALVHEAYLRLVGADDPGWDGRGHFFAPAAG